MKCIKLIVLAVAAVSCAALTSCGSNAVANDPVYIAPSK